MNDSHKSLTTESTTDLLTLSQDRRSLTWKIGLAAAVEKNRLCQNEAQRASLAKANARVLELTYARREAYAKTPRLCQHCSKPIDYRRVTKENAKFCNRSCSATFNNRHRPRAGSGDIPRTNRSHIDIPASFVNKIQIEKTNPRHVIRYRVGDDCGLEYQSRLICESVGEALGISWPHQTNLARPRPVELWRQLADIASKRCLIDWSKALLDNVDVYVNGYPEQKAMAGYLIYLMTTDSSNPLCAPLFDLVRSGQINQEIDSLLPEWHHADAEVRVFYYAAHMAQITWMIN